MQVHVPDPLYTGSRAVRTSFRVAVEIALAFVALLWLIQLFNWTLDLELQRFGVRPREWQGLVGILLAPLLHADFFHLLANTLPLLVLGTVMLHLYPKTPVVDYGISREELVEQAVWFSLLGIGVKHQVIRRYYNPKALALFGRRGLQLPAKRLRSFGPLLILQIHLSFIEEHVVRRRGGVGVHEQAQLRQTDIVEAGARQRPKRLARIRRIAAERDKAIQAERAAAAATTPALEAPATAAE